MTFTDNRAGLSLVTITDRSVKNNNSLKKKQGFNLMSLF